MSPSWTAPLSDEIEVSLFGPGVGESTVLHIGNGRWVIVDSCRDRSAQVASLAYLESIGVSPERDVDWVIATHAHDDHIDGMAETVGRCSSAQVVLPSAATIEEFLAIAEISSRIDLYDVHWTIHREISEVLSHLKSPNQQKRLHFAGAGTVLPLGWRANSGDPCLEFHAPSGTADMRSRRAYGHLLGAALRGTAGPRVSRRDPNSYSIALTVRAQGAAILMGGDVVNGGPGWGWKHIVTFLDAERPADVFKVAHHGSGPAHLPELWATHLKRECACLVSPFRSSGLPAASDIARMHTTHKPIHVTAGAGPIAASSQVKAVARRIPQAQRVQEVSGIQGQVQWRCRPGQKPKIALFGPARSA